MKQEYIELRLLFCSEAVCISVSQCLLFFCLLLSLPGQYGLKIPVDLCGVSGE